MKKSFFASAITLFATVLLFAACKKDKDNPQPHEAELITTIVLSLNDGSSTNTYTYKVENGFNNPTSGSVQVDTLNLSPNTSYQVSVTVLNETASDDHTMADILEEKDEHLFLFVSTPDSGNGTLVFSNGNQDNNGQPFNHTGKLDSDGAGQGQLEVFLMHAPTNKSGASPAASGGSTDAHGIFPVRIQ